MPRNASPPFDFQQTTYYIATRRAIRRVSNLQATTTTILLSTTTLWRRRKLQCACTLPQTCSGAPRRKPLLRHVRLRVYTGMRLPSKNCAAEGAGLWGILRRSTTPQLSDWMRQPREAGTLQWMHRTPVNLLTHVWHSRIRSGWGMVTSTDCGECKVVALLDCDRQPNESILRDNLCGRSTRIGQGEFLAPPPSAASSKLTVLGGMCACDNEGKKLGRAPCPAPATTSHHRRDLNWSHPRRRPQQFERCYTQDRAVDQDGCAQWKIAVTSPSRPNQPRQHFANESRHSPALWWRHPSR